MTWQQTRGAAATAAVRRSAHSDDAKERHDESSRVRRPRSGRLVLLVAAGALVLLAGGTAAGLIASRGEEDAAPSAGTTSRPGPSPTGGTTRSSADGPPSLASGVTFAGRSAFNTRLHARGATRIVVTCDPRCRVGVAASRGHGPITSWVRAAAAHDYLGSGSRWRHQGSPLSSCTQLDQDPWADPGRWTAEMTLHESRVSIRAVFARFDGGRCVATRTTMRFTGVRVP